MPETENTKRKRRVKRRQAGNYEAPVVNEPQGSRPVPTWQPPAP